MSHFEYHALVPAERERVWDVLVNPANLSKLTPARFRLAVEERHSALSPGAFVFLEFSFLGRRWPWSSVISAVEAPVRLVEEQREGPLAAWKHEIQLRENTWGTEVVESVDYQLRYGMLGALVDRLKVERAMQNLFEHREAALLSLLSRPSAALPPQLPVAPALELEGLEQENVLPLPPRRGKAVSLLV